MTTDNIEVCKSNDREFHILFTASLIEIDSTFWKKIVHGYATDPIWKKISDILDASRKSDIELLFIKNNTGLVYQLERYISGDYAFVPRQLCIFDHA